MDFPGDLPNIAQINTLIRILSWIIAFVVALAISVRTAKAKDANGFRIITLILFVPLTLLFAAGACLGILSVLQPKGDTRIVLSIPLLLVAVGMVLFYRKLLHATVKLNKLSDREAIADERDRIADERDRIAGEREWFSTGTSDSDAQQEAKRAAKEARLAAAVARDAATDARIAASSARDAAAIAREVMANRRDAAADERDLAADKCEAEANAKDISS